MPDKLIESEVFENIDFSQEKLTYAIFEECQFTVCNFEKVNLTNYVFVECVFTGCNFSLTNFTNASIQGAEFRKCKMMGVRFDQCNQSLLSFSFNECILHLASFRQLKIPGTKFLNCNLKEVDFTESNLTKALIKQSDLYLAVFDNTLLENADLRTAENYSIDPENNYVNGAKVSLNGLPGMLQKYGLEIE